MADGTSISFRTDGVTGFYNINRFMKSIVDAANYYHPYFFLLIQDIHQALEDYSSKSIQNICSRYKYSFWRPVSVIIQVPGHVLMFFKNHVYLRDAINAKMLVYSRDSWINDIEMHDIVGNYRDNIWSHYGFVEVNIPTVKVTPQFASNCGWAMIRGFFKLGLLAGDHIIQFLIDFLSILFAQNCVTR